MDKRKLGISVMLIVISLLMFSPIVAYANEVNDNEGITTTENDENTKEEMQDEDLTKKDGKGKEATERPSVDNQKSDDNAQNESKLTTTDNQSVVHKVAVITTKVDENGNQLSGAVLQILDSNGNVVDEWTSNGKEHTSLLPEGDYVLHEKSAPNGYKIALDKTFTVKVVERDVTATTDHDDTACTHYPTELYYIESNGIREEVYCINQGLDEPNNINYDGVVLTEDNIRTLMPDSDPTMSDTELYDKVLDIIYHRTQIEDGYLGLTNSEIRLITEYALKNYTSTLYNNGSWARRYAYSENDPKGYIVDVGNGNTIGKLAQHWWTKVPYGHGEKLPKKYADYFFYLIRDEDHHPADMHLYVYSTGEGSDSESYQNLLSVKWHNPYDDNHKVSLTMINEKKPIKEKKLKKITKSSVIVNPQTGDSIVKYIFTLTLSIGSLTGCSFCLIRKDY